MSRSRLATVLVGLTAASATNGTVSHPSSLDGLTICHPPDIRFKFGKDTMDVDRKDKGSCSGVGYKVQGYTPTAGGHLDFDSNKCMSDVKEVHIHTSMEKLTVRLDHGDWNCHTNYKEKGKDMCWKCNSGYTDESCGDGCHLDCNNWQVPSPPPGDGKGKHRRRRSPWPPASDCPCWNHGPEPTPTPTPTPDSRRRTPTPSAGCDDVPSGFTCKKSSHCDSGDGYYHTGSEDVESCAAACSQSNCPCFDYRDTSSTANNAGCRVAKSGNVKPGSDGYAAFTPASTQIV